MTVEDDEQSLISEPADHVNFSGEVLRDSDEDSTRSRLPPANALKSPRSQTPSNSGLADVTDGPMSPIRSGIRSLRKASSFSKTRSLASIAAEEVERTAVQSSRGSPTSQKTKRSRPASAGRSAAGLPIEMNKWISLLPRDLQKVVLPIVRGDVKSKSPTPTAKAAATVVSIPEAEPVKKTPLPGAQKEVEAFVSELLILKKQLQDAETERTMLKARLIRSELDLKRTEKALDEVMNSGKGDTIQNSAALADKLRQQISVGRKLKLRVQELEEQMGAKDHELYKLRNNEKTLKINELEEQIIVFYEEIRRLQSLLAEKEGPGIATPAPEAPTEPASLDLQRKYNTLKARHKALKRAFVSLRMEKEQLELLRWQVPDEFGPPDAIPLPPEPSPAAAPRLIPTPPTTARPERRPRSEEERAAFLSKKQEKAQRIQFKIAGIRIQALIRGALTRLRLRRAKRAHMDLLRAAEDNVAREQASIAVQRRWRGTQARKYVQELSVAAQHQRLQQEHTNLRRDKAACVIQRAYRCHLAKKQIRAIIANAAAHEDLQQRLALDLAASSIQRGYRSHRTHLGEVSRRREAQALKELEATRRREAEALHARRRDAASVLQRVYRGHRARKLVRELRKSTATGLLTKSRSDARTEAARCIQRAFRRYKGRQEGQRFMETASRQIAEAKAQRERIEAATAIQATYRGHKDRQLVATKRANQEALRNTAATSIQRGWRSKQGRAEGTRRLNDTANEIRSGAELAAKEQAAVAIQSNWRGHSSRKEAQKRAAEQRATRAAEKALGRKALAAIDMQKAVRGFLARIGVKKTKAAHQESLPSRWQEEYDNLDLPEVPTDDSLSANGSNEFNIDRYSDAG